MGVLATMHVGRLLVALAQGVVSRGSALETPHALAALPVMDSVTASDVRHAIFNTADRKPARSKAAAA